MKVYSSIRLFHFLVAAFLLAFVSLAPRQAQAATPDPRMYGPWVVVDSESVENVGLRAFFSPDGNFLMVDPKTQMGFSGNWSVGRVGLLVSILGASQWAKLWEGDVSFADNDKMILDVKESHFSQPHRITLQRIKF
jgi:hypothetical protein